jgi:drug/metabolite transporter (DMT)-like permease
MNEMPPKPETGADTASETDSSDPRMIMLYALLAVSIWGAFTAVAAGAISQGASFISVGITTQVGVALALGIVALRFSYTLWTVLRRSLRYWPVMLMASVLFPARDILFLYALSNAQKLTVTAIDALWPIFLVVFSALFFRAQRGDFEPFKFVMLVSAFGGAILVISGDEAVMNFFADPKLSSPALFVPYACAVLGAMAAAGENLTLRFIREQTGLPNMVSTTICLSAIARVLGAVYMVVGIHAYDIQISLPKLSVINVGYLIIGWTIASIVLTHAVLSANQKEKFGVNQISMANVGSIAYLSPVINAVILSIFFPEEKLSGVVVAGISIVVVANFLINSGARYAKATYGTLIFTSWFSVVSIFTEPVGQSEFLFTLAQVAGTILAILASFTLWRLSDLMVRWRALISQIGRSAETVLEAAKREGADVYGRFLALYDRMMRGLVSDLFTYSQAARSNLLVSSLAKQDQNPGLFQAVIEFEELARKTLRYGPPAVPAALGDLAEGFDRGSVRAEHGN